MFDFDDLEEKQAMTEVPAGRETAHVIVIGGGLAGMTTANTVLQAGGRVLVLEKSKACGGNSAKAASGISAAGTKMQRERGIADSAESFLEDVRSRGAKNSELVQVLCNQSASAAEWLAVAFGLDLSLVSRLGGHSAPRTHRGKDRMPGVAMIHALVAAVEEAAAKSARAQVVVHAHARRLLAAADGACIGCAYVCRGSTEEVEVYGPVVLCTGGFGADFSRNSLLARWRPDLLHLPTTSNEHCTGDGIRLAAEIGARAVDLEWVQVLPTGLVKPSNEDAKVKLLAAEALRGAGGLLLNSYGDRFCYELGSASDIVVEMWKSTAPFWLILNRAAASETAQHCKQYVHHGLMRFYGSGDALAKEMGISVGKLEATHEAHYQDYQAAQLGENDASSGSVSSGKRFYRNAIPASSVRAEAYYAALVTPVIHCCMGGLEIDSTGAVLASDGSTIKGLYAAGEVAGGVHGADCLGGNSLLECVVFGRLAGESCMKMLSGGAEALSAGRTSPAASRLQASTAEVLPAADSGAGSSSGPAAAGELAELRARAAMGHLERLLEDRLTAGVLQEALASAHAQGGNLDAAVEELCRRVSGEKRSNGGRPNLELELVDRAGRGATLLPTQRACVALPEAAGVCAEVPLTCVHCRLPLTLEVCRGSLPSEEEAAGTEVSDAPSKGLYAYATLLYGGKAEYFLGALVIGHSLKASGSSLDRVLMHTEDVPTPFLEVLANLWTLRRVQYVEGSRRLYKKYNTSRFKAVFTKLQALSCVDYEKVLMLDLDMLVRSNIDCLFELSTPAAMKRASGRGQPSHGGTFDSRDLWRTDGEDMCSGINAGVMLLQPDLRVYKRMVAEVKDHNHPEHVSTYGPEQDYLSRFYGTFLSGAWTHIHSRYNYQLMLPDDYVSAEHRALDVERDVVVAHYSGPRVKPWELQRDTPLDLESLRRLLQDDSVRNSFTRERAPPPDRSGGRGNAGGRGGRSSPGDRGQAAQPRERIMDGVLVVEHGGPQPIPEPCQAVMWEWVLALRACAAELSRTAGVDLLEVMAAASKTPLGTS